MHQSILEYWLRFLLFHCLYLDDDTSSALIIHKHHELSTFFRALPPPAITQNHLPCPGRAVWDGADDRLGLDSSTLLKIHRCTSSLTSQQEGIVAV